MYISFKLRKKRYIIMSDAYGFQLRQIRGYDKNGKLLYTAFYYSSLVSLIDDLINLGILNTPKVINTVINTLQDLQNELQGIKKEIKESCEEINESKRISKERKN